MSALTLQYERSGVFLPRLGLWLDPSRRRTGPEKVFAGMPESQLHQMFSYGDPTVYGVAVAGDRLLIRTGQQLYCVSK